MASCDTISISCPWVSVLTPSMSSLRYSVPTGACSKVDDTQVACSAVWLLSTYIQTGRHYKGWQWIMIHLQYRILLFYDQSSEAVWQLRSTGIGQPTLKNTVALEEWNVEHQLIQIHLGKRQNRTPEYKQLHPQDLSPHSYTINRFIGNQTRLSLHSPKTVQRWCQPLKQQIMPALNLFLWKCTFQRWAGVHFMEQKIYPLIGKQQIELPDEAHQRLHSSLAILEKQLDSKDHLFERFSIVDCAFAPWLPYLNLSDYPNMNRWLTNWGKKKQLECLRI